MLSLKATTEKLVAILDADPAANQPVFLVSTGNGENLVGLLTGDTVKELAVGDSPPLPPTGISSVTIYNKDTASVNVTLSKVVGDTTYNLVKEAIPSGGTLSWVPGTAPVVTTGAAAAVAVVGASAQAEVTAAESGAGPYRQTVLTLTAMPITLGNTTGISFGSKKLYDFPEGRINFLGVQLNDLTVGLGGAGNVTPIDAADGGDIALGTTATADATLSGTDVNLLPSTSIDPMSAGITDAVLASSAVIDGRATALDMFLNMIVDDADVADGASDIITISGTITITWVMMGND